MLFVVILVLLIIFFASIEGGQDVCLRVETDPDLIWKYEEECAVFRTASDMEEYKTLSKSAKIPYTFSGSPDYCRGLLHIAMAKHGYRYVQPNTVKGKLFYIRQDQMLNPKSKFDRRMYKLKCVVKNFGDTSELRIMKHQLPENPGLIEFMPKTWLFDDFVWQPGVYMAKLSGSWTSGGHGNVIMQSEADLEFVKKKILSRPPVGTVVQEYIANPLLLNGVKFHYRVYLMITTRGYSICPYWRHITAKLPYRQGDWGNLLIHDSHAKTTAEYTWWPQYISDQRVADGITAICEAIVACCSGFKAFPECDNAYQILAPDIMFDENFKPYLLEINSTPRLSNLKMPRNEILEPLFTTWEFENGILPFM